MYMQLFTTPELYKSVEFNDRILTTGIKWNQIDNDFK